MKKGLLIHNPRCSKSREAQALLRELGVEFAAHDYLEVGLSPELLAQLPGMLGLAFKEMVRKNESLYKELALDQQDISDQEWIALLQKHPVLLERPIFIYDDKAVIGRPPELVKTLL